MFKGANHIVNLVSQVHAPRKSFCWQMGLAADWWLKWRMIRHTRRVRSMLEVFYWLFFNKLRILPVCLNICHFNHQAAVRLSRQRKPSFPCKHVCTCVSICMYICVRTHVHMSAYACMYACTCAYICKHMFACIDAGRLSCPGQAFFDVISTTYFCHPLQLNWLHPKASPYLATRYIHTHQTQIVSVASRSLHHACAAPCSCLTRQCLITLCCRWLF